MFVCVYVYIYIFIILIISTRHSIMKQSPKFIYSLMLIHSIFQTKIDKKNDYSGFLTITRKAALFPQYLSAMRGCCFICTSSWTFLYFFIILSCFSFFAYSFPNHSEMLISSLIFMYKYMSSCVHLQNENKFMIYYVA